MRRASIRLERAVELQQIGPIGCGGTGAIFLLVLGRPQEQLKLARYAVTMLLQLCKKVFTVCAAHRCGDPSQVFGIARQDMRLQIIQVLNAMLNTA